MSHTAKLLEAVYSWHVDDARALLMGGRADPTVHGSFMLRHAAWAGHEAMVRALLTDGRAEPVAVCRTWCAPALWPTMQAAVRWRRRRRLVRAAAVEKPPAL
jgi:hypothetical protein